ncbi:MAG: Transcription elongation factor GreA [Candidatus Parcubacteria bacterium]|jgi:transcription elongation factor GreA
MKALRFTKQGYEDLQKKYQETLASRPDAVEHLRKSREMGDLSENGYYKSSRAKLSFIDRQLREMSSSLKRATVISTHNNTTIGIGCKVTLEIDGTVEHFEIVGDMEADPGNGKISLLSPLGSVLNGKTKNDTAILKAPSGERHYSIKDINY